MVKLKIRTSPTSRNYLIPIPYPLLHLAIGIATSRWLRAIINRSIRDREEGEKFQIPDISRQDLKPLLKQLKKHKGLKLVDIVSEDGSEVSIKL
ncbi:hypothetical protein Q7A53_10095 [Halobacillus rhizosphaerae]|uniref:hypothetical protein n=1 Tax=Halobacillus rhizosphaerae TaxID=3064889 RepID=UPI00398AC1BC